MLVPKESQPRHVEFRKLARSEWYGGSICATTASAIRVKPGSVCQAFFTAKRAHFLFVVLPIRYRNMSTCKSHINKIQVAVCEGNLTPAARHA